jgi:hypothetical protein
VSGHPDDPDGRWTHRRNPQLPAHDVFPAERMECEGLVHHDDRLAVEPIVLVEKAPPRRGIPMTRIR